MGRLGVGIDLRDRSAPGHGLVRAGADRYGLALAVFVAVQFIDTSLDAISAALHQRDKGVGAVRAVIAAVGRVSALVVDGLDDAVDRGRHLTGAVLVLERVKLLLLELDVVLRFLILRLKRLNLHGVGQLVGFRRLILRLLQLGDLGGVVRHGVAELLDLQRFLVDRELHLLRVIGEQHLSGRDLLANLDFDLGNRAVVVLLDLHLVLRHDHTGADVAAAGHAVAHDLGDGLHIHRLLLAAAARKQAKQQHKRQYDRQILCFHCVPPNPEPSEPRGSVCCSFDVAFRKPFRRFF